MRVRLVIEFDWEARFGELPLNKAEVIEAAQKDPSFIPWILASPFLVSVEEAPNAK